MTDHTLPTPEMKAGTPDLFLVDTMTAIQMGPRNLKKYMYEIQEEGKKLGLVVKVEKTNSGLILWWYPQEMAEELEKLEENVSWDPRNKFWTEVEGAIDLDANQLIKEYQINWPKIQSWIDSMFHNKEGFQVVPRTQLIPHDDGMTQLQEIFFTALEEKGLIGHVEQNQTELLTFTWEPKPTTFFDDVLQHMSAVPEGQMEAEKKLLLESVDVETMDELLGFFKTAGEVLKLDITMMYSSSGENVTLYWGPRETLADDQTATPA